MTTTDFNFLVTAIMEYQSLLFCFDLEDADLLLFVSIAFPCRVLEGKDEKNNSSVYAVDEMMKYTHTESPKS
jgi:hypothetical protein